MVKTTFIVEQKDVDKQWSLKDLKTFSARTGVRVIVRKFCIFDSGNLVWLA